MKTDLETYFNVLYAADPASVGGTLPADDFTMQAKSAEVDARIDLPCWGRMQASAPANAAVAKGRRHPCVDSDLAVCRHGAGARRAVSGYAPADTGALAQLAPTAAFWQRIVFSALRIMAGFLLAAAGACFLAQRAHVGIGVQVFIDPAMQLIRAMPVASFVILALLWVRSANLSVVVSFTHVLPVVYAGVLGGIADTDPKLLEMAKVYRLPRPRGCGTSGCRAFSRRSAKAASPPWACAGRAASRRRSSVCRITALATRSTAPKSRCPHRMCLPGRWLSCCCRRRCPAAAAALLRTAKDTSLRGGTRVSIVITEPLQKIRQYAGFAALFYLDGGPPHGADGPFRLRQDHAAADPAGTGVRGLRHSDRRRNARRRFSGGSPLPAADRHRELDADRPWSVTAGGRAGAARPGLYGCRAGAACGAALRRAEAPCRLLRALLCRDAKTLLLDEPFTGMDAELVADAVAATKRPDGERPTILVTHDRTAADLLGWPVREV